MGSGGMPSGGVTIIHASRHISLSKTGKPNSRTDLYVNGVKVQSRWYDWEGKAVRNRDYAHTNSDESHEFPHDHIWSWKNGIPERSKEYDAPDYINFPEDDI